MMSKKAVNTKSFLLLIIGLFIVGGTLLTVMLYMFNSNDEVATVDEHAISQQELTFYMQQLRPKIQNEFQTKYQRPLSKEDWYKKVDGTTPMDQLQQQALAQIVKDKTLLIVGKQQHLIEHIDYADIIQAMNTENKSRTEAISRGEIVYGLTSFTPQSYYSHLLTSLRTELKKKLSQSPNDPLYIDNKDAYAYFNAHQADWTVNATTYEMTKLHIPSTQQQKATTLQQITQDLQQNMSLTMIQNKYKLPQKIAETITPDSNTSQNSYQNELIMKLRNTDDASKPIFIETKQGFDLYQLEHTAINKEEAFKQYQAQITQTLLEDRLNTYLKHVQQSLPVTVDQPKISTVLATSSFMML